MDQTVLKDEDNETESMCEFFYFCRDDLLLRLLSQSFGKNYSLAD